MGLIASAFYVSFWCFGVFFVPFFSPSWYNLLDATFCFLSACSRVLMLSSIFILSAGLSQNELVHRLLIKVSFEGFSNVQGICFENSSELVILLFVILLIWVAWTPCRIWSRMVWPLKRTEFLHLKSPIATFSEKGKSMFWKVIVLYINMLSHLCS